MHTLIRRRIESCRGYFEDLESRIYVEDTPNFQCSKPMSRELQKIKNFQFFIFFPKVSRNFQRVFRDTQAHISSIFGRR